ncbi:DUF2184 domain-containing protein [Chromobacterium haemolyticum]|nr:DUF2184 domain-containing protein [Chromobacterium haemolyticum]
MDMSEAFSLKRREIVQVTDRALVKHFTKDSQYTYDAATLDSAGAFLIGELERLDQTMHEPLVDYTWSRDIDIRTDVSAADELSSFTNSSFAAAGGLTPNGLSWIGKDGNAITGPSLDIGKTAQPLRLWGQEVKYTIPELVSAQKLGRPVDAQKFEAMRMKHQMDIDQMVYFGDPLLGVYGFLNSPLVTNVTNVATVSGHVKWADKSPDDILADVNEILTSAWQASAWAVLPNTLLLPPAQYGYIASAKVSNAGNVSILKYILENNICRQKGQELRIDPVKWLIGTGVGGTQGQLGTVDRMVAYSKDMKRVRYPMTELQRTPLEYRSLYQLTTYWCRLGQMEFVYPTTLAYRDGI